MEILGLMETGEVNETDVAVSGIELQSNLGDSEVFPDRGWGGRTWSHGNWGEVKQTDIQLTGIELQSSTGLSNAFPEFGWGGGVWNSNVGGWGNLSDTSITAGSFELQSSIGEEGTEGEINAGWGRLTWNNNQGWGISGTLQTDSIQLQTTVSDVTVDANKPLAGED